jgi:hypothetical protein
MTPSQPTPPAARFLEWALLFTFLAHTLAMLAMAVLLLPGMPGGGAADDAARVAYIAGHGWLWRLGWFFWQMTTFSDLLLALALWRTAWIPRLPAVLVILATLAAAVPEQIGEVQWITRGVHLAQDADRTGDLAGYLSFETAIYPLVAGWAGAGYAVAFLAWAWCFAAAGTWSRRLTWLTVATWAVFFPASVALLLPASLQPAPLLIAVGNALGFVLLLAWLIGVTERVLRRARPDGPHGRDAPWRHPRTGLLGWALDGVANSRFARALCEWLPPVSFASDITNVFYVNYLVEAERLECLVPWGLELQRLGPGGRYAFFTFLTFRHGHFGPRLLGPLRRLLPSPVQSNWRIHVRDPQTGVLGIYFVTTAITSTPHALAARLLSEGIPMHLLAAGTVSADADGSFRVHLDPGKGSGPDADLTLRPAAAPALPAPWSECFASYHDMLAYCVPQDRALSGQPWYNRVTRQEIRLGIPLESCEPLAGDVHSRAAQATVGDALPLCFRVAQVAFRFDREEYDRRLTLLPPAPGHPVLELLPGHPEAENTHQDAQERDQSAKKQ